MSWQQDVDAKLEDWGPVSGQWAMIPVDVPADPDSLDTGAEPTLFDPAVQP